MTEARGEERVPDGLFFVPAPLLEDEAMTDHIDLKALRELEAAAAAVPWMDFAHLEPDRFASGIVMRGVDWRLASAARNALPALIRLAEADIRMQRFVDENGDTSDPEAQEIEDEQRAALAPFLPETETP